MKQRFDSMPGCDIYAAFMMDHAVGALPPSLRVAGDLHVLLSQGGSDMFAAWSVIGGALLETVDCAPQDERPRRTWSEVSVNASDLALCDFDSLKWRGGLSGVSYAPSGVKGGRFIRLREGEAAPRHGHKCLEAMVVLEGRFEDGRNEYECGDLALADESVQHTPRAVGGDCVCYVGREKTGLWIL